MNILYRKNTLLLGSAKDLIYLPYRHLYIENLGTLPNATIQVLYNENVILELANNEYLDLKDLISENTFLSADVKQNTQTEKIQVYASNAVNTAYKLINYGLK